MTPAFFQQSACLVTVEEGGGDPKGTNSFERRTNPLSDTLANEAGPPVAIYRRFSDLHTCMARQIHYQRTGIPAILHRSQASFHPPNPPVVGTCAAQRGAHRYFFCTHQEVSENDYGPRKSDEIWYSVKIICVNLKNERTLRLDYHVSYEKNWIGKMR